jgi:hypothetical protein
MTKLKGTALATLILALGSLPALAAGPVKSSQSSSYDNPWPYAGAPHSPLLVTVGDVSCQPGEPVEGEKQSDVCDKTGTGDTTRLQAQIATAQQIEKMHPDLVAILGDEQYQAGRYEDFMNSFDLTYGAFKFLHRPAPGNHEFYDSHGETGVNGYGYFDYYNGFLRNSDTTPMLHTFTDSTGGTFTQPVPRPDGQAGHFGNNGDGWYSYDLGTWHIISLNVECAVEPGGCDPNGAWLKRETQWLAQDLASDHAYCTLAYWHQPTFTVADTSASDEGKAAVAWWQLLYKYGADVILNGHDHTYARYAPMDPGGNADPKKGIREFIVGTGGESLDQPVTNSNTPNLEAATGDYYGVMGLILDDKGYEWDYESALKDPGASPDLPATFKDTGKTRCHG